MCVLAQMETCRGAIHRFKLNTLVLGKLLLFRRVEFRFDRSLPSLLSYFSFLLFCIDCVCVRMCVFPGPTVSPPTDFAHYGFCARTQHVPVFIKETIA